MINTRRLWGFTQAESIEELCRILTSRTMTCCTAFRFGRFLFLNDATSEDGAQEYAVLRPEGSAWLQVESITFSWISQADAVQRLKEVMGGDEVPMGTWRPNIEPYDRHSCQLCR